jgi:uncharacterized membrane protein YphA (DoxX/SURF4 family)
MSLVSPFARPALAAAFVVDGVDAVLHPDKHAEKLRRLEPTLRKAGVPSALYANPKLLTRASGAVSAVAGLMLATGRSPRAAALTLAAINVPLTVVHNPVWAATNPTQRREYLSGLLRGFSLGGGLLFAAADRGGKPSWGWRVENAREHRSELREAKAAVKDRYKD